MDRKIRISVSVIILTKNEELDIPACLKSVEWCDDVHVVDSGSDDDTIEIATRAGARVLCHKFESFGHQRNWALDNCKIAHDWILFLDADEQTPPAMVAEMHRRIEQTGSDVAGFYCCWKLILNERWLKRSDNYPKWQFRLLRRNRARFTDFGHGQKEGEVQGTLEYLREPYLHLPFRRGWKHWLEKHGRYAKQEAIARTAGGGTLTALFSRHASRRNPALKMLFARVPGWPTIRFLHSYVLKGGFLEGREGLEYCLHMRWFERRVQDEIANRDAR